MKYQAILAKEALIGNELEKKENVCVLVADGKIEQIMGQGDYRKLNIESCREIHLERGTLLPGLIECHNHVALDARLENHLNMMELSETELAIMAIRNLEDDLMSGVTTARCLGDRHYLDVIFKKEIQKGTVKGPNLLVAGIGMKGRHGHGYVGLPHSGVEEFRRTARENMYRGVDILKIFVTAGAPPMAGEFIPYYISPEEIKLVVEEAGQLNIHTAAHCIGGEGLRYCVEAGIDVIEHAYSITDEDARLLKEKDVWVDLTSGIFLDSDREPYCPQDFVRNVRHNREKVRTCVKRVIDYGIPFTLGTDAYHTYLYKELEYAVELGANSREALKAVTSRAAQMCGISKRTGSIEPGLNADLIATEKNPLENVSELAKISFVMKDGKIEKGICIDMN